MLRNRLWSPRHARAVRDLRHADVGIGEHRLRGLDVLAGEFWRAPSDAAGAPSRSKTRLCALADQAALELRQRAKHMKNQSDSSTQPLRLNV
jgi:hypothetical protein